MLRQRVKGPVPGQAERANAAALMKLWGNPKMIAERGVGGKGRLLRLIPRHDPCGRVTAGPLDRSLGSMMSRQQAKRTPW